ncbi:hypothetical protein ARMA_1157 [Ardenticatena maritima]|uniref:Uncharacterized protein n=1 Tax=Ardenticatena maritima TaxID=872965 RepID=A0A0N0RFK9_9CHLR|nr:hypothetical protein ARMA_1157 [Ardenticatena maritima]
MFPRHRFTGQRWDDALAFMTTTPAITTPPSVASRNRTPSYRSQETRRR